MNVRRAGNERSAVRESGRLIELWSSIVREVSGGGSVCEAGRLREVRGMVDLRSRRSWRVAHARRDWGSEASAGIDSREGSSGRSSIRSERIISRLPSITDTVSV